MYTRILMAIGGSPWSDSALTYAIDFAARIKAELDILTVLSASIDSRDTKREPLTALAIADLEKAAQEILDEAADLAGQAGVASTSHMTWSPAVPTAILNTAMTIGSDLIVMGSRREAGLEREHLGNISNTVVANAPQPVLVVKRPLALEALFGRRVLVATGGSPWSDYAVEHAMGLAQVLDLGVCVLHVAQTHELSCSHTAMSAGKPILERAQVWATAANIAYEGILASGLVPETILETAMTKQCSAIIMGTRGVTGWGRLTPGKIIDTVAARARLPVLIVKPYAQ